MALNWSYNISLPWKGEGEEVRDGGDDEQDARVHHAAPGLYVHGPPEVGLSFGMWRPHTHLSDVYDISGHHISFSGALM